MPASRLGCVRWGDLVGGTRRFPGPPLLILWPCVGSVLLARPKASTGVSCLLFIMIRQNLNLIGRIICSQYVLPNKKVEVKPLGEFLPVGLTVGYPVLCGGHWRGGEGLAPAFSPQRTQGKAEWWCLSLGPPTQH